MDRLCLNGKWALIIIYWRRPAKEQHRNYRQPLTALIHRLQIMAANQMYAQLEKYMLT